MLKPIVVFFLCGLATLSGCKKANKTPAPKNQTQATRVQQEPGPPKYDACALLTNEEIEAIEGSPVKDRNNSGRSDAGLSFAQCFFTTAEFSRSVSLTVIQPDPAATPRRNIKELWEETFGKNAVGEKEEPQDKEKRQSLAEQKGEKGEKERAVPPRKIQGIGEEAFWAGNRVGGALYVLKKDAYVRVSVGGPDPEEKKIEKCKALAQKALDRL